MLPARPARAPLDLREGAGCLAHRGASVVGPMDDRPAPGGAVGGGQTSGSSAVATFSDSALRPLLEPRLLPLDGTLNCCSESTISSTSPHSTTSSSTTFCHRRCCFCSRLARMKVRMLAMAVSKQPIDLPYCPVEAWRRASSTSSLTDDSTDSILTLCVTRVRKLSCVLRACKRERSCARAQPAA